MNSWHIRTYKVETRGYLATRKIKYIETNELRKEDKNWDPFKEELGFQIGIPKVLNGQKWIYYCNWQKKSKPSRVLPKAKDYIFSIT